MGAHRKQGLGTMETGPATRMFAEFCRTLKISQESSSSKILCEIKGFSHHWYLMELSKEQERLCVYLD